MRMQILCTSIDGCMQIIRNRADINMYIPEGASISLTGSYRAKKLLIKSYVLTKKNCIIWVFPFPVDVNYA